MIYSFDIFDTCLVRKCGHPENMLDVLSWRVFSAPIDEMSRREFVCARKQAENDLYSDPFANIYDIYSHLNYTHLGLQSKEELANQEIMCERMLLTPVLEMQTLINKLRNEGHQIAFISDMYLPFGFLKELLSQYDLLKEDDNLFVSCQVGKRKSDGTLFQYLHQEYGWKYSDWHHYGDNITSDYHIPRKLGINAHKINHSYAPYESQWVRTDYSENRTKSIIAGICRAIRLGDTQNTHTNFVLDIVAPLYASFVWRIMEDAANNGIRKLFFCARDAYLIYLVALKYHQFFPSIEIKYLYISQQSLYKGNEKCRLRYFDQIGLASKIDKVAIVDIRSSGHTLSSINQEVQAQGCLPVRGYFFEIYCNKGDMTYRSNNYVTVCLLRIIKKTYWILFVLFSLTFILLITKYKTPYLHFGFLSAYAALYIIVGYIGKTLYRSMSLKCDVLLLVLLIGLFYFFPHPGVVETTKKTFVLYFPLSIISSYVMFDICQRIQSSKSRFVAMIKFIGGGNTLIILTLHFLSFKLVSWLIVKIYGLGVTHIAEFPIISSYSENGWWIVYSIVGVALPLMYGMIRKFVKDMICKR